MFGKREVMAENPVAAVERAAAEAIERGPGLGDLGMLAAAELRGSPRGLRSYRIVWKYLKRTMLPGAEADEILGAAADLRLAEIALFDARAARPSDEDFRVEKIRLSDVLRRRPAHEEVHQGDFDRSVQRILDQRYGDAIRIASVRVEQAEQRLVELLGISWRTYLAANR